MPGELVNARPAASDLDAALLAARSQREMRSFRTFALVVLLVLAATIAWILPWMHVGMTTGDYGPASVAAVLLLLLSCLLVGAFALRWAPMMMLEPKTELIRAVLGESMLVRSRKRFLRRLEFQCEQALRDRTRLFSLMVIRLVDLHRDEISGPRIIARALAVVRATVRVADVVGDSEADEIWVLLVGAGLAGSERAAARIALALADELGGTQGRVRRIGWSASGVDGADVDTLFRTARRRADLGLGAAGAQAARDAETRDRKTGESRVQGVA